MILHCNFCGQSEDVVLAMVRADGDYTICLACAAKATKMMTDDLMAERFRHLNESRPAVQGDIEPLPTDAGPPAKE